MGSWLEHKRLGYNYRMDEMSAALGVSQLRRIESFLQSRERVALSYTERLRRFDWVRPPLVRPHVRMSWFVYVVTLADGLNRDEVMRQMEAQGVPARAYFSPVHMQPYIREQFGSSNLRLPVTESVANRTIALPFHNSLTETHVDQVVAALAHAVGRSNSETVEA
jgi:perosamine synthetase